MIKDSENPYLSGKLLIAMPGMSDPRFHKAVIFMCVHDDNGAMGLVINHALPGVSFAELLQQLDISDIQKSQYDLDAIPVMNGGPVETGRGFLLHPASYISKDTIRIDEEICVTGTVDALGDVARGDGPAQFLFLLGYAGWGAGQLDSEIHQNAWLVADPDPAILFHNSCDDKWMMSVRQLGFDPFMLSGDAGHA